MKANAPKFITLLKALIVAGTLAGLVWLIGHELQLKRPDKLFVTQAGSIDMCLSCHTEAAKQVMRTSHWTWICPRAKEELAEREHIAVIGDGALTGGMKIPGLT